ncbi:cell death abnormality protein 1-like [Haliotis rufescens]|uniref:cell death abnormality protein 1-like n=1 Tax=Haliotis rufescens TaxID=6454 RepID=UPI00201EFB3E|nr:cell death abnormality protein 1-like [Haliotis rufescens]
MAFHVFFFSLLAGFCLNTQEGHGLDCQDTFPQCPIDITPSMCEQPGIASACSATCQTCQLHDDGNQCVSGYVEKRNKCQSCGNLSLQEIFQTRECPQGCHLGNWGRNCSIPCSPGCYAGCEKWSGQCLHGCHNGFYGTHCDLHCENCGASGRCGIDGTCMHGCKFGFSGTLCLEHTNN